MKYKVKKDFEDADRPVFDKDGETKVPFSKKAGDTFIPAETNYPLDKVAALVADGTLELIQPPVPAKTAKKK